MGNSLNRGSEHILVLDEDEHFVSHCCACLNKYGYSTHALSDSNLLLETLAKQEFELVLLPVHFRGIKGIELLKKIKSTNEFKNIAVVMVAPDNMDNSIAELFECDAEDYIRKPINDTELCARVECSIDVFQNKRMQEKHSHANDQLNALTQVAPIGIYTTDTLGKCTYVNECWQNMAGMSLQQAQDDGWQEALHPDDKDEVFAAWDKMVESNGNWGKDYRFIDSAGKTRWVHGLVKKIMN